MADVGPLNPDRSVAISYPDVPPDLVGKLQELITALDRSSSTLNSSAERVQSFMGQANGAVQQVAAISQGNATQALVQTWSLSLTDSQQSQHGMNSAASHISTTTSALSEGLQTIKNNMGTLEMVRSNGGYVSAMNADEVQAQIVDLSNALGNIGMALDAAAKLLSKLNGGWPMACATGFASGSSVYPTFAPNAFESTGAFDSPKGANKMDQVKRSGDGGDEPSSANDPMDELAGPGEMALSDVVAGQLGQIRELQPAVWATLTEADRIGVLQRVNTMLGRIFLNGKPYKLIFSEILPKGEGITTPVPPEITIARKSVRDNNPAMALETLLHEGYHTYQYRLQELARRDEAPLGSPAHTWLRNSKAYIQAPILDYPYPPDLTSEQRIRINNRAEAQFWKYAGQPIEFDADNFAQSVIAQLFY